MTITIDDLKLTLCYNSSTGIFTWKNPSCSKIKPGDIAGTVNKNGYLYIKINAKTYRAHRLAWFYHYGVWPKEDTDHVDGIKLNNAIINMRDIPKSENNKNKCIPSNNTSGHVGVTWNKKARKWKSQISSKDGRVYLGSFDELDEAVKIRKEAEIKYGYHKNHGRKK